MLSRFVARVLVVLMAATGFAFMQPAALRVAHALTTGPYAPSLLTTFDAPGWIQGFNARGDVVTGSNSVRTATGLRMINVPGALATFVTAINDNGERARLCHDRRLVQ
jgi:hypothetical protein